MLTREIFRWFKMKIMTITGTTPDTSRIDETSFTVPDTAEATSTLRLRQKVKRDKLTSLYRHLNMMGNPDLIDLDRFRLRTDLKKGAAIFEFYNNDRWVPLTKQTGEFFAPKTLRDRFGTPPLLERSLKGASKLKSKLPTDLQMESIPLKELSSLVEEIHVKTRKSSQNNNLDMREFLGIDKALQSIQGELLNNTSKLTEIDRQVKKDAKKLEEVENDPTYTNEQRQLYRDRLDGSNTEKQVRLEILSQNRKDLQTQVARIKQTIEKVLDKDTSLAGRICTLFREQGITIFSILTALSMTITGVFGGGGGRGAGGSLPEDEETLKKWLDRLANGLKRLAGKTVEALPAIVGSAVGAILSFFGKAVGFVAKHTWALIVFIARLVGWWLTQKVKKS